MAEAVRAVTWDAYEHYYSERGSDWFWILGIATATFGIAAILVGNVLLGIVIFLSGTLIGVLAKREPRIIPFAVTPRGVRIGETLYPYTTLECYCIDGEHILGPQLLVKSEKLFMPLLVIPIPDDAIDEIEEVVAQKLPEAHLEEPLGHRLLEFFNF